MHHARIFMYSMYIFLKKCYSRILDSAEAQLLMTETNYGIYEQKILQKTACTIKVFQKILILRILKLLLIVLTFKQRHNKSLIFDLKNK